MLDSESGLSYSASVVVDVKPLVEKLTVRWLKMIIVANNILMRTKTGKLMKSPAFQLELEKSVATHLGIFKRVF